MTLLRSLFRDEAGFVVSAELVLIGTILVLSMVVGLSEVSANVNQELYDLGSAFGSLNQSCMDGQNACRPKDCQQDFCGPLQSTPPQPEGW